MGKGGRKQERDSVSAEARCPFYMRDSMTSVVCEGMIRGSSTRHSFRRAEAAEAYKNRYCRGEYGDCSYCKMMYGIYRE